MCGSISPLGKRPQTPLRRQQLPALRAGGAPGSPEHPRAGISWLVAPLGHPCCPGQWQQCNIGYFYQGAHLPQPCPPSLPAFPVYKAHKSPLGPESRAPVIQAISSDNRLLFKPPLISQFTPPKPLLGGAALCSVRETPSPELFTRPENDFFPPLLFLLVYCILLSCHIIEIMFMASRPQHHLAFNQPQKQFIALYTLLPWPLSLKSLLPSNG